jgi:hypothetical protein
MNKFSLSLVEASIIGNWFVDTYSRSVPTEISQFGSSSLFLPNRLLLIFFDRRKVGEIRYVIGQWRVKEGHLLVRLRARLINSQVSTDKNSSSLNVEFGNPSKEIDILVLPKYEIAYVNREGYSFTGIPAAVRQYYGLTDVDLPRFRMLLDNIPLASIDPKSKNGRILLNPIWSSAYLLKMLSAWEYRN